MRVWPALVVLALSGLGVALALGFPLKQASVGVVPALVDGLVLLAVLRVDPANRLVWRRPEADDLPAVAVSSSSRDSHGVDLVADRGAS